MTSSVQKQVDRSPATYQPSKRAIGELLAVTSPPIIVPDWQRSYSWTLSHVETFWNDLLYFEQRHQPGSAGQYFLGTVVIVETSTTEHLLLDGQQRLATSAILLSVIRDFAKLFKESAAQRIQARYLADFDDAKDETVYKLTLNAYDREFFRRKILEYRDASYTEPKSEYASHRLISGARNYFEEVFSEKRNELQPDEANKWFLRIQNVLMNHLTVIAVTSTDEDSAAEVFETLNDRGIGLSTPDLLRNFVMRRASPAVRDDIVDLWREVIEFETDSKIKLFLRHYWISNHGDVKTQSLYREIKSHILSTEEDSLVFSRSLRDGAQLYREIISAQSDNEKIESLLQNISDIGAGARILYPVIMSIVQTVSEETQAVLIEALLNLYIRHSVIGRLENSKLENVIYKVATVLRADGNSDDALAALAAFAPDNDSVTTAFQRLSVSQNGPRRYLLLKIEGYKRTTEELGVNPPSKVHVEHIYPQTPKEGNRLPDHTLIINRMGNLTLLGKKLNTAIKNGTFAEKKPSYKESEINMTKELCDYDHWDAETIASRQKALSQVIPAIWPIISVDV